MRNGKRLITFILICIMICSGCQSPVNESISNNSDVLDTSLSSGTVSDSGFSISENISDNAEAIEEEVIESIEDIEVEVSFNEVELKSTVSMSRLPENLKDIEYLQEKYKELFNDPHFVVSVYLSCLNVYAEDETEGLLMINNIKGEELTDYEQNMFTDHLKHNEYIPMSYFEGTSPDNYYEATEPYTVYIYEEAKKSWLFQDGSYVKLYVFSSGAEKWRPVTLEYNEDLARWIVFEDGLLADIYEAGYIPEIDDSIE